MAFWHNYRTRCGAGSWDFNYSVPNAAAAKNDQKIFRFWTRLSQAQSDLDLESKLKFLIMKILIKKFKINLFHSDKHCTSIFTARLAVDAVIRVFIKLRVLDDAVLLLDVFDDFHFHS